MWPVLLVIVAWSLLLVASWTNHLSLLDHDYLLRASHLPWLVALGWFLACWQLMTVAMMLPATLPVVSALPSVSRKPGHLWLIQAVFITEYLAVWTGFALLAFLGDTFMHQMVNRWFWLYTHSWMIGGVLFVVAGGFQLSPLKKRCLQQCSHPFNWYQSFYRQGIGSIWRLGLRYGWFCLGSCWAVMLVMFGVGVRSLLGLVLLAGVIWAEKGVPTGQRLRPVIGVVFLLLGMLWLAFPIWVLSGSGG